MDFAEAQRLAQQPPKPHSGLVPTWSFSTLKSFETCPYRVYLSKVEKAQEPQGNAAARGNIVHAAAEAFVRGEVDELVTELSLFEPAIRTLREQYEAGEVEIEGEWGFTTDWEPCDWSDDALWGKMKLDVFHRDAEDSARVIDYKTGKRKGNEIKHTDQGMFYTVGTMMKYPEIQYVQAEFWYTDLGERMVKTYTRQHITALLPRIEARAYALTNCHNFEPVPSSHNCRWCPHKETGVCQYAEGA